MKTTPLVYYLNWAGLFLMGTIVLAELRNIKKQKKDESHKNTHEFYEAGSDRPHDLEHKKHKPIVKPILVILIAGLIFFGEQLPALTDFHENLAAGYFRFIFKIFIGVIMLSYGLSNMEGENH